MDRLITLRAFAIVATLAAQAATAATIETFADVDFENGDAVANDADGPASAGSLISTASAGLGTAEAAMNIAGVAGLKVDVGSAGGGVVSVLVARATWSDTVINTSLLTQRYQALISIPAIALHIQDGVAAPSQRSIASYAITLDIDGVSEFFSAATLQSGSTATGPELITSGTDLGGVATPDGGFQRGVVYAFAPFSATIDLGDFAPSASFTALYRLELALEMPGLEIFADASIGDPLNLTGSPLAFQSSPSAVPLPAACWLLTPALAGLGLRRRR